MTLVILTMTVKIRMFIMIFGKIIPLTRLEYYIRYEVLLFYHFDALENITNALYPPPVSHRLGKNHTNHSSRIQDQFCLHPKWNFGPLEKTVTTTHLHVYEFYLVVEATYICMVAATFRGKILGVKVYRHGVLFIAQMQLYL